jgi:hypothetical protein
MHKRDRQPRPTTISCKAHDYDSITETVFTWNPLTDSDKPREACGLFGVFNHPDAAKMCYFGLYALQHRGQESAGIAVAENGCHRRVQGDGAGSRCF